MKKSALLPFLIFLAGSVHAQIQVELKLKRLQYIAYEPVFASVAVTNLAGRDIELHDDHGQHWFGFEVSGKEGQPIGPVGRLEGEAPLRVESGKTVVRRVNLTPLYAVQDLGTYHVRANIYFADLNKFFYSQARAFQVINARPIWQTTVGIPEGMPGAGQARTYSLLSNRFADHTSLYVRVENKESGSVYATYSLGRIIAYDEPQKEIDRANQLHVLHCTAPRTWAYSHIGLNGQLLKARNVHGNKDAPAFTTHFRRGYRDQWRNARCPSCVCRSSSRAETFHAAGAIAERRRVMTRGKFTRGVAFFVFAFYLCDVSVGLARTQDEIDVTRTESKCEPCRRGRD